jgi:hypothetical protein
MGSWPFLSFNIMRPWVLWHGFFKVNDGRILGSDEFLQKLLAEVETTSPANALAGPEEDAPSGNILTE